MQYGNLIPKIYPTGIFIQSIEQTKTSDESGGENVFTATLTNHTQQHFVVKNGKTGSGCEGINEIRASVDSNVGTPSVEVVETDAGAKKNVNFIFKNLKGETGNIALTEEVKQHISQSVASANQYTNNLLIKIFQNGYIQGPGMKSPLEDTALHFEGYSWYEVNYDGNFFRAKGRNAKPFSSKKLTKEQIKNGDYIFQDDEQEDAIRNIKGSFKKGQGGYESFDYTGCSGVFQASDTHRTNDTATGVTVSQYDNTKQIIFDTSKDSNLKTAEENRSRNLTFIVWVLVKDE
ncbi:hypothetical protein [Treponema sp. OMZ 838]|uniref:hypothetical protein n=1 Tax=Treponema sp. OMZ 838 TaxID=1539298 RepID=UPI00068FA3C9|nr:hypothetical protein [Treponema sp. OMZ 838]